MTNNGHCHRAVRLILLALSATTLCSADVEFTLLPSAGEIYVQPLETVGWGYSIRNNTGHFLLPLGLSASGVPYGNLLDIFDYPVVGPGETAYQAYAYNAPGGFGNSLGLYEYNAPADLPIGLHQTGTITLLYQFYNNNPDLDWNAVPIADQRSAGADFELSAGQPTAVPEPATILLLGTAAALVCVGRRMRRT